MYNYETNSDLVLEIFGDILRFFEISGLEKNSANTCINSDLDPGLDQRGFCETFSQKSPELSRHLSSSCLHPFDSSKSFFFCV